MQNKVRKAMILAAGEGTRLLPLTLDTPKPLLPIAGIPLIEHTLQWLKCHGLSEVAINLHHLGDKIVDFVGDGSRFGIKVVYSHEREILGTAGGVKAMQSFFDNTFVVCYGDNLTDFDLSAIIRFHQKKKSMATLAVFESPNPSEVGVVRMDANGMVLHLAEKPKSSASCSPSTVLANAGIYVLEYQVLDYIPERGVFSDFGHDVFPRMLADKLTIYGYRLNPKDYFIDIGTMEKYQQANEDARAGSVKVLSSTLKVQGSTSTSAPSLK